MNIKLYNIWLLQQELQTLTVTIIIASFHNSHILNKYPGVRYDDYDDMSPTAIKGLFTSASIGTREYFQSKQILVRNYGVRATDEFLCVETDCRLCLN